MQLDHYIGIEQVKAQTKQAPTILVATVATAILVVIVLWSHFPMHLTLFWLSTTCTLAAIRWRRVQVEKRTTLSPENYQQRLNRLTVGTFFYSINAGAATFLFHDPAAPAYSIFLLCLYTAFVSASAASISSYLPAFLASAIPVTILFVIRYITEPDQLYRIMGATTPMYLLVMSGIAVVINRNFVAAKNLEFENERLLKEVTTQRNLAEKAITEKDRFLAATSHDLRQPLHALGLYVDALRPRLNDSLNQEILEKINQSGSALGGLLHSILDISRLDAAVIENRPQHIYLSQVAQRLSDEFSSQIEQSGLELQIDIDQEHVILVDPILLERVLRNLLSNAIKYTNNGFVKLSSAIKDGCVEVAIADSGIGVAAENIDAIFSEFTQLDNPERDRNKGLGLGLAIVKRLCKLQNIEYRFDSIQGEGTTVTLFLRQGDKSLRALDKTHSNAEAKQLTILFVDDEQAIRDGMAMLISSWQCVPIIADGVEQAMEIVQALDTDLDIIISDLRLREQDNGIELVKKIREELNQDVPAIIVTGDTAVSRLELAKHSNVVMMHKPIQSAKLRQAVVSLLDNLNET